ncbi:MAG: hypothetical protein U9Q40_10925, partial [Campylobacterota bacterium]|nr:hypothetical protein [Campylobacterota bacterium]
ENEHYSIELLKESQILKDSKRVNTYEYVAYVKKEGPISFDFDLVMKKTTQESVNSVIRGHYDDSKSESFTSSPMKQVPLSVNIKDTSSKLVGEFTLQVKQDTPKIAAYEPYHLEIQIEGVGNFSNLDSMYFTIDGVKIFTQGAVLKSKLTQGGEKGVWSQKFAFVSEKSFKIPEISIDYFNLQTDLLERLTFDRVNVNVDKSAYKKEDLLDIEEKKDSLYKPEYLYYPLSFLVGFFLAKIKLNIFKPQRREEEPFLKSIKETTSLEKLCFLLVNKDVQIYKELISQIESKELTSLKKAKNIVSKILRNQLG